MHRRTNTYTSLYVSHDLDIADKILRVNSGLGLVGIGKSPIDGDDKLEINGSVSALSLKTLNSTFKCSLTPTTLTANRILTLPNIDKDLQYISNQDVLTTSSPSFVGILLGNGSLSTPSIRFSDETNTGIYKLTTNNLNLVTNGVSRFDITNTGVSCNLPITISSGDIYINGAGTKHALYFRSNTTEKGQFAYCYTSDDYIIGSTLDDIVINNSTINKNILFGINGSKIVNISGTGQSITGTLSTTSRIDSTHSGSAGTPTLYFGDTASGIYKSGTNTIGFSSNSLLVLETTTTGTNHNSGTVTNPSLYFGGENLTGFYRIGSNNIGFSVNSSKVLDVQATGIGIIGRLGIGTTSLLTTHDIGFDGTINRTIGVEPSTGGVLGYDLTVSSGDASSGGTDLNGGTMRISSGLSTGTGRSETRLNRVSKSPTTGTAYNVYYDAMIICNEIPLTSGANTNLFEVDLPVGAMASLSVSFGITASGLNGGVGAYQARNGFYQVVAINTNGTINTAQSFAVGVEVSPTGALNHTWSVVNGTGKITIRLVATATIITSQVLKLYMNINNNCTRAITLLL